MSSRAASRSTPSTTRSVMLEVGDSLYMDSQMAHTYTSAGDEDAEILMVWLSPAAHSTSDNTRMVESLLNRKP